MEKGGGDFSGSWPGPPTVSNKKVLHLIASNSTDVEISDDLTFGGSASGSTGGGTLSGATPGTSFAVLIWIFGRSFLDDSNRGHGYRTI